MPRPYNQKTVKDALLLLDIYASMPMAGFDAAASAAEVRPSSTGYRVAEHLVDKIADMFPEEIVAVVASEAAGLLREGWRIGDEIPTRGSSATLESVDSILRKQYGASNVEAMANAPSPTYSLSPETWAIESPSPVTEVLAEPLDAVEEPTDEEIEQDLSREDPTHEDPYGMEPSE